MKSWIPFGLGFASTFGLVASSFAIQFIPTPEIVDWTRRAVEPPSFALDAETQRNEGFLIALHVLQPSNNSPSSDSDRDQRINAMSADEMLKAGRDAKNQARNSLKTVDNLVESARKRRDRIQADIIGQMQREIQQLIQIVDSSVTKLESAIRDGDLKAARDQMKTIDIALERIQNLEEEAKRVPETPASDDPPMDEPLDPTEPGFGDLPLDDDVPTDGAGAGAGAANGGGATGGGGGGGGSVGGDLGALGLLGAAAAAIGFAANDDDNVPLASPFSPEPILPPEQGAATSGPFGSFAVPGAIGMGPEQGAAIGGDFGSFAR